MKYKLIAAILLFLLSGYLQAQDVLISDDGDWKYLHADSHLGIAWYETGYDDEAWNSGPEAGKQYPVSYFRKSFSVSDPELYSHLVLETIDNDRMVIYLNGVQIWRENMPEPIANLTYTSETIDGDPASSRLSINMSNQLASGSNVIAVEIQHENLAVSDIELDFKLTAYETLPAAVIRGPYLQTGTPGSVIVKWRTNVPTGSIIRYGTSLNSLIESVSEDTPKIDHELTLSGLTPSTQYYYEISDAAGTYLPAHSDMFVITSPPAGTKQFVRAWILGDAGTANQNQFNVRDQYYNYVAGADKETDQTDMMLFLGDNAYSDGTDYEYQTALFDVYDDMLKKSVAWSTLGNHDGHSAASSTQSGPYYDIFSFPTSGEAGGTPSGTEAYYSFDYANIHFIVLESHQLHNHSTQMDWCLSDIQATTQDWIVAFFHHPPYTKGSHDSDTENQLLAMRNNFLPMLEDNGVDLVLTGHSHSYERSYFINGHYGLSSTFDPVIHTVGSNGNLSGKEDTADGAYVKAPTDTKGAVYITTGSAGKISGGELNHNAMFTSLNQLGSSVLEVDTDGGNGQKLTVKFLRDDGTIGDYFTIHKTDDSTSANDCTSSSNQAFVDLFPNPSGKYLNIELGKNENYKSATIYNSIGELVQYASNQAIDISSLSPGEYFVKINTDSQFHFRPFVIN